MSRLPAPKNFCGCPAWEQYCGAGQHWRLTLFSSVCWFVVLLLLLLFFVVVVVVFKIHGSKILIAPPHQFIFLSQSV